MKVICYTLFFCPLLLYLYLRPSGRGSHQRQSEDYSARCRATSTFLDAKLLKIIYTAKDAKNENWGMRLFLLLTPKVIPGYLADCHERDFKSDTLIFFFIHLDTAIQLLKFLYESEGQAF